MNNELCVKTWKSFYKFNKFESKIFEYILKQSAKIYNTSIYYSNIYFRFKKYIFNDFYKLNSNENPNEKIEKIFDYYCDWYSKNKNIIFEMNQDIYKFIKDNVEILLNDNFESEKIRLAKDLQKFNKNLLFEDTVNNIFKSFYLKNYNKTRDEILSKKPCSIQNTKFIEQVKKKECLFTFDEKENIKKSEYDFKSDQTFIQKKIYKELKVNSDLSSDIITNVIRKSFENYKSYFALKNKGIKSNYPKFLPEDSYFNIFLFDNGAFKKIDKNTIRITVGELDLTKFDSNLICLNPDKQRKKYINKNHKDWKISLKKVAKSKYYINGNMILDKNNKNIIDGTYLHLKINPKIVNKDITMIEIGKNKNDFLSLFIRYYEKKPKRENKEYVSIDLGVNNLCSIFDNSGNSYLIKGGEIKSINYYFGKKIDKLKSMNGNLESNQMKRLRQKRENKINDCLNKVVSWISKKYEDKKIIIGYNKGWKTEVNFSKKTNRTFYEIPFSRLIEKLKNKLNVKTREESYTSKCDALGNEEVKIQNVYLGSRIKRGLFSSSKGKLINADINGSINILRKEIGDFAINKKCLNPINISCEVF
jgi:IS605 OrfB family transposase